MRVNEQDLADALATLRASGFALPPAAPLLDADPPKDTP